MTSRAWWFLLFALLLLGLAALPRLLGRPLMAEPALLGLTLLLWFIGEWFLFRWRSQFLVRRVLVRREVRNDRGPVDTLWAGRTFQVHVRLQVNSLLGLPHVAVAEWVPFGLERQDGVTVVEGSLRAGSALELDYRVRCPAPGRVRFEGVRVEMADYQGFFYRTVFLRDPLELRVLPVLAGDHDTAATTKHYNLLPPPGVHRLRRPGSGSELLDLRDYLPGDPPKTIAWKVSARRDRLITKEFESEVPLRCTLFVDTSSSVRVGPPGGNALTRLVEIAAAVAQANAASRDLTGLCLFDEQAATSLRPARTPRHLAELLNRLADSAGLAPTQATVPAEHLLPLAYAVAQEVYPELMRPDLNRFPAWLPWLSPRPSWARARPRGSDWLYGWLPLIAFVLLLGSCGLSGAVGLFLLVLGLNFGPAEALVLGVGGFVVVGLVGLLVTLRLFGRERQREAQRKRLAALLSVRYGLAPGGLEALLEDDRHFSLAVQRFLAEHRVPYALPLYDDRGRYLFRAPGKVEVLARAVLDGIGKGHDNELFVLLVDVLELEDDLGPLLKAVKVALARHHQVVLVCPSPRRGTRSGGPLAPRVEGLSTRGASGPPAGVESLLDEATAARLEQSYQRLRRSFARLGVTVVNAAGDEPVPLILERMERLRKAGIRPTPGGKPR
jgi:uncharacterized protein (DUF58 family)